MDAALSGNGYYLPVRVIQNGHTMESGIKPGKPAFER
jgi:hypothetical protein